MSVHRNRRGAVHFVAAAFLALFATGITMYIISKPFQTHVKEAVNQATQWTPENIRADPAGYLKWAIAEIDKTRQNLEASELCLNKTKIEVTNKVQKKELEKSQTESLMADLKKAYATASENKSWPVKVGEVQFDERQLKRKIVECDDSLTSATNLVQTYSQALRVMNDRLDEIDGQLIKIEQLKTKLTTDLETAEVKQSFAGIDGVRSDFADIVATSDALAKATGKGSLADMMKPPSEDRVNTQFAKIMGQNKNALAAK